MTRKDRSQEDILREKLRLPPPRRLVVGMPDYIPNNRPPPLMMMLDAPVGKWNIDKPIREMMALGLIDAHDDTVHRVRKEVVSAVVGAIGEAAGDAVLQDASHEIRERSRSALELAKSLRTFVEAVDEDFDRYDEMVAAFPELAGDNIGFAESYARFRSSADDVASFLTAYAERPASPPRNAARNLKALFFAAVEQLWNGLVGGKEARRAKAIKNRFAAALWLDMGWEMKMKAGDAAEEWAKQGFRELGERGKNP